MHSIIFVNRFFYPDLSATSQMLSDLASSLANRRPVTVVTSRLRYDEPAARLPSRERVNGVQVVRVWSTRFGRSRLLGRGLDYLTFYLTAAWALLRLVRRGDQVIAKTDPPLIGLVAALVCICKRAMLIHWIQDLFPEVAIAHGLRIARSPIGKGLLLLRNWAARHAVLNVVLSEAMYAHLSSQGVSANRLRIIANWADEALLAPQPASINALRHEWGLAQFFVVGYAGNLGRAHDERIIFEAAHCLRTRDDIRFLITGGGAGYEWLSDAVRAAGLTNVLFKPYQPRERLAEVLGISDIHLVSLRPEMEGLLLPSKLYGVLAVGRPVIFIGQRTSEIARLLQQNRCGVCVCSNDGLGLAKAVTTLAADPESRSEQATNARALFESRFSRAVGVKEWERSLETLKNG